MSGSRFRSVARFLLACGLAAACLPALAQSAQEHEVKAAFLYRFLSFMEWPAAPRPADAPLVIGVLGAPEIAAELERVVTGRTVQGRPVTVRRLRPSDSPAGVHLLMVGRAEAERIPALARAAPASRTLVIGESEGALDQGAAINFLLDEGRVRFDVSLPAAERSQVRISSRMLSVAREVRGAKP